MWKATKRWVDGRQLRRTAGAALCAAGALGCGVTRGEPAGSRGGATAVPSLLVPKDLLKDVTALTVDVFSTEVGRECLPKTGELGGLDDGATPLARVRLATAACADGVRFCGAVALEQSAEPRLFHAVAAGPTGTVAEGCAQVVVDSPSVAVGITMVRRAPAAVCGDGVVQSTEQCEGPANSVCDSRCQTREVFLSSGTVAAGTTSGRPGDKSSPFFLWPAGGRFHAFFSDRSAPVRSIGLRVLDGAFAPTASLGPVIEAGAVFMSGVVGSPVGVPATHDQGSPVATTLASSTFVVSSVNLGPTGLDIQLRVLDAGLSATDAAPVGINGGDDGRGEPGTQNVPQVASGPGGRLLVVWQDEESGKLSGRTWRPVDRVLGPQVDLAASARRPRVAATATGWRIVYESGGDVRLRDVDGMGAPIGTESVVNEAGRQGPHEQPTLAVASDGGYAVAWTDRGAPRGADIALQRFAPNGIRTAGDQASAVNDVIAAGDQTTPAITSLREGGYALAWVDESTGQIEAKLVGARVGTLPNNVNGLATEFTASLEGRRTRGNPTVAVGGTGPFLAIGWEDRTGDERAGIYGRRFPVPLFTR